MNFKQIPLELVDNHVIFASKDGQIKIIEKLIVGSKSNKGANGYYTQTKTKVKLDNGKIVEYNKDIKNQVEKCYHDSTEYACPMILELKKKK